jgi:hypothetical protein
VEALIEIDLVTGIRRFARDPKKQIVLDPISARLADVRERPRL